MLVGPDDRAPDACQGNCVDPRCAFVERKAVLHPCGVLERFRVATQDVDCCVLGSDGACRCLCGIAIAGSPMLSNRPIGRTATYRSHGVAYGSFLLTH